MIPTSTISDPFQRVRRDEFPELVDGCYLNAASLGPLPARARAAMQAHLAARAAVHRMKDADFSGPPANARSAAARLIGADPNEIALSGTTSLGINIAALGLQVAPGSTVLVSDREFPANVYPWMNRDRFLLELVPTDERGWPDEDRLLDRISAGDVSVLAISSVQFISGFRADLHRLGTECRSRGVLMVVDAIQSLGQLPLDVRATPIDILATSGHKWLCGPFGTGFLYVRSEIMDRLEPEVIGWPSMVASQQFENVIDYRWELVAGARRFEIGTAAFHDLAGLAASMEMLVEADPRAVAAFLDDLLAPLRDWLLEHPEVVIESSFDEHRRSGIVGFRPPGLASCARALRKAGVIVSVREDTIRIAAHLYNTSQNISQLLQVLEDCARDEWR